MTYTMIHTIRFLIFSLILIISLFTGIKANAYFTTNQKAITLSNHTGLFLIEYAFGVPGHTVQLPIMSSSSNEKSTSTVSFSILDENDKETKGKIVSLVLSDSPMVNYQMYSVPKNISKKFTLAVFFTPEDQVASTKYRLQVTNLPFNFDTTQQLQLNPSELQYYTTKSISL